MRSYRYQVYVVCALLILIDGYDGATLTYAAPALVSAIKLDASTLGPLFAAHLVGMICGSGPSGFIADRRGRRPVILFSTVLFALFTFLMATASSFDQILVYRLMAGLGLGAAISNTVALASEYSSESSRATVVSTIYSALPLGALVGGYIGVVLIPAFGWQSIFVLGGVLAVATLVAAQWGMPESTQFLREARASAQIGRAPWKDLFADGNAGKTLLLWLAFFVNQVLIYFLFMWTPIVFKMRGLSTDLGIVAAATLNLGGVVGAVCLGRLVDAYGARRVLTASYVAAFVLIAAFGAAASSGAIAVVTTVGLIGFVLNGSNVNLAAVATSLYPTQARSTGTGWAMGIGRAGAIAGSLGGGVLLRAKIPLNILYSLAGSTLLLAALAIWVMHGSERRMPAQAELR
jgi:MFS transporter, AAHS family, 4-hydroxybenzoate transporter